ncbi:N/A [soil metagenome]
MKKKARKKFYKKKALSKKKVIVVLPKSKIVPKDSSMTRLVLPPVVLVSILFLTISAYILMQVLIRQTHVPRSPFTYSPLSFPVISLPEAPVLSAESAIIMDNTSKTILYQKNPQFRFSMASTTKLTTALVGLSEHALSDVLTVKRVKVEGVNVGLTIGEQMRYEDMLYALLLPSGNDAAYAIADNDPEGSVGFVKKMNEKAISLGLENTHFGDPAGLEDDEDYTTVKDLVKIMSVAISTPELATVIGTKQKTISDITGIKQYTFSNLNKLLGVNGVTGGKTGTTEGAGEVLVISQVTEGRTYIIIVMKSSDRFSDTEKLLQLIQENVTLVSPRYPFLPTVK